MKKFIVLISLILFPLSMLSAHPAGHMGVGFSGGGLKVKVVHSVRSSVEKDMKKHYIKTLTVTLNGVIVKEATFTSQNGEELQYKFSFPAKINDKIVATATCNLGGEKSAELIVK